VFTPSSTALSRSSRILSVLPRKTTVATEFPSTSFFTMVTCISYHKKGKSYATHKNKNKNKLGNKPILVKSIT